MGYIGQTPTAVALDGDDLADDIITLAKLASGTDGNVISYDASGDPVAIATGTDGQVLTSTGAGSPPAFEAIPAGGVDGITSSANATAITISADEEVNMPLQPCFQVQAAAQTDQTGDGTTHTANLTNEIFDIGGNFASKTFTAPITGKYILCAALQWVAGQYGTTDLANISLVTSNRTYYTGTETTNAIHTQHAMNLTRIADMDASDTAYITWRISGGSKTSDHVADTSTSLSGCLIA